MRRALILILVAAFLLAACGEDNPATPAAQPSDGTVGDPCEGENLPTFRPGTLTVATDRPAYPPWFEGGPRQYSGYEGEVASQVADRLGLPINWVVEPFNKSYAPGAKDFDFDINQITITPERSEVVDFSDPYFTNNQGVLTLAGSPAADATSISDLKDLQLGAQVGTTALTFINTVVQPTKQPKIFDSTNDLKSALDSGQIDAFVTDVVTTVYLRDFEVKGSKVIGQYPEPEYFGMLFEKGNPLRECVNEVLAEMEDDGTLETLQGEWLQDYLSVPNLEG